MAELALRTTEFLNRKPRYTAWRPVGSVVVALSDRIIRRKWIEIAADLVSPAKRDRFRHIPGWDALTKAWTPEVREAWLALRRGELGAADDAWFWANHIVPTGIEKDLPLAPESAVRVCDTWLWSDHERRTFFIVANTDATDDEIEAMSWHEERERDGRKVVSPAARIDYLTDIGLSADTLDKIADPDQVVHPRFDKPVAKAEARRPDLSALSTMEVR